MKGVADTRLRCTEQYATTVETLLFCPVASMLIMMFTLSIADYYLYMGIKNLVYSLTSNALSAVNLNTS